MYRDPVQSLEAPSFQAAVAMLNGSEIKKE